MHMLGGFLHKAAFDWSTEVSIYISLEHQRKGFGKSLTQNLKTIIEIRAVKKHIRLWWRARSRMSI